jgi:hypothetical protein
MRSDLNTNRFSTNTPSFLIQTSTEASNQFFFQTQKNNKDGVLFYFSRYICYVLRMILTRVDPTYVIYMGRDKEENEELIKYGFPEDIWSVLMIVGY